MPNSLSPRSPQTLLTLLLASFSLSACTVARMPVPPELSPEAKVMAVEKTHVFWVFGLKEMTFGPYRMTDYQKGWTQMNMVEMSSFDATRSKHKFEFKLTPEQGRTWQGRCRVAASKKGVSGEAAIGTWSVAFDLKSTLSCTFIEDRDAGSWTLELSLQTSKSFNSVGLLGGELTDGTRRFRVEGTDRVEGLKYPAGSASGFSIRDQDKVLGAVQVMNSPRVWMDPAVEAELGPPLALVSTALILQPNLLEMMENSD